CTFENLVCCGSAASSHELAMGERGQLCTYLSEILEIDLSEYDARAIGKFAQDLSPRIDYHRMTVGLKAFCTLPKLIGSDDIDLVLDGPCAKQRFPMGFTGVGRKRRRHKNNFSALST